MFRNYFSVAYRNLKRHKVFSLINIAGLAIGISTALVIYLIVQYELSFDTFHKNGDKIYRVVSKIEFPDLIIHNSGVPVPAANAVCNEAMEISDVAHVINANVFKVSVPIAVAESPARALRTE